MKFTDVRAVQEDQQKSIKIFYDNEEEKGVVCGFGTTEKEAMLDLCKNIWLLAQAEEKENGI